MSIKDKMNYAAAVAKWKTDQQLRLMRTQGAIRDIEIKIGNQKTALSDAAIYLYLNHKLSEESLVKICDGIADLHSQIQSLNQAVERIKQEQPPANPAVNQMVVNSGVVSTSSFSGLVCPECGKPLVGRFCPDHGKEGVLIQPLEAELPLEELSGLVCPQCQMPLVGRFCPTHGVEGVDPSMLIEDSSPSSDAPAEIVEPSENS